MASKMLPCVRGNKKPVQTQTPTGFEIRCACGVYVETWFRNHPTVKATKGYCTRVWNDRNRRGFVSRLLGTR